MAKRIILICIALLLSASVAMVSWLICYHATEEIGYSDLTFREFSYEGNTLSFAVEADADGYFLYRVQTDIVDNELHLTFLGGKQPMLAQTPTGKVAHFSVTIPEGVIYVLCGEHTVYSF